MVYHAHSEDTETGLFKIDKVKRLTAPISPMLFSQITICGLILLERITPQAILDILAKEAPEGIGTVYFITLLYFISLSEYPIYDQFAKKAIDAIKTGTKPNITIPYKELPDRNNSDFSKSEKL